MQKKTKVFSIIGVSNSGKTTTLVSVARELRRRRYSVATVKNIHCRDFSMDVEGSDTDRHKKAGAQVVVARGLWETSLLFPRQLHIDELIQYFDHDFIIMEGVSDCLFPKIITAQTVKEIEERLDPTVFAISGVIASTITRYKHLPVINCLKNIYTLVDYIEERFSLGSDTVTTGENAMLED